MRMVKSLLLGSAAGVVAVAGAQAADLPVKAKPVEYVRVCSLYGAGFWYVPGTDTCLKIGSYIREQVEWNAGNGGTPIGLGTGGDVGAGRFDRTDTSQLSMRTRAGLSVDLRTQTEYGTLRSYFEGGFQASANNGSAPSNDVVYFDRGFIQFAGLTAGRIRSYFDINSMAPYSYLNTRVSGDTGALGLWGIAYTAQFGNGFSATLSFEDGGSSSQGNSQGQSSSRGHLVNNMSMASQWGLGTESFDNEGWKFPDVVGSLRVDQAWGYAQIAAAVHDASAGYYQTGGTTLTTGIQGNGHPGDAHGWAVTGGFTLNDVLGMKGDQFGMQAVYTVGAAGYATRALGAWEVYGAGNNVGVGWVSDGIFTTGSGIELTSVWGVNGFYQHFWNPKWRTSIHGGYEEVDYGGTATSMICGAGGAGGAVAAPAGVALTGVSNCSPNFSWWELGSRTQWNPHPDLDIGVDVVWDHLNTAFSGTAFLAANGARPGGVYTVSDQDVLEVYFRIQRNFLP
ncbi:MAG TPA: porin [Xanthobacteraceae bacterium]|nr:porin [Xanthobacteraceae bacterium]